MCLYPRLMKNPKYKKNKKNGGVIPPILDKRIKLVPIGCGKCIECRREKAREWQIRMAEEIKENKDGKFITLTFSNEALRELKPAVKIRIKAKTDQEKKYIYENELATIAVRRFLERWRRKYKKSVKHWLVTELGHEGTKRIHLHGILFTKVDNEEIERIWKYGHIWVGDYVNEKTINYIIKYVTKIDLDNKGYESKILTSPGIGRNYMNRTDWKRNIYKGKDTEETYIYKSGNKAKLPIYYRNKIYTEEEREKLWINMLDKEVRYVMGEKISIKESEESYYEILKVARLKNKRLGYGDDEKEWLVRDYRGEREKLKKYKKEEEEKRKSILED